MSLTELDDDTVRSMAIGAVFGDFVSFTFVLLSVSFPFFLVNFHSKIISSSFIGSQVCMHEFGVRN